MYNKVLVTTLHKKTASKTTKNSWNATSNMSSSGTDKLLGRVAKCGTYGCARYWDNKTANFFAHYAWDVMYLLNIAEQKIPSKSKVGQNRVEVRHTSIREHFQGNFSEFWRRCASVRLNKKILKMVEMGYFWSLFPNIAEQKISLNCITFFKNMHLFHKPISM